MISLRVSVSKFHKYDLVVLSISRMHRFVDACPNVYLDEAKLRTGFDNDNPFTSTVGTGKTSDLFVFLITHKQREYGNPPALHFSLNTLS